MWWISCGGDVIRKRIRRGGDREAEPRFSAFRETLVCLSKFVWKSTL